MYKKYISALAMIMVVIIFIMIVNSIEEGNKNPKDFRVIIESEHISFSDDTGKPYINEDNLAMLPMDYSLSRLKDKIIVKNSDGALSRRGEGVELSAAVGQATVTKNGEEIVMPTPIVLKDEKVYIPIGIFKLLGYNASWYDSKRYMVIDYGSASTEYIGQNGDSYLYFPLIETDGHYNINGPIIKEKIPNATGLYDFSSYLKNSRQPFSSFRDCYMEWYWGRREKEPFSGGLVTTEIFVLLPSSSRYIIVDKDYNLLAYAFGSVWKDGAYHIAFNTDIPFDSKVAREEIHNIMDEVMSGYNANNFLFVKSSTETEKSLGFDITAPTGIDLGNMYCNITYIKKLPQSEEDWQKFAEESMLNLINHGGFSIRGSLIEESSSKIRDRYRLPYNSTSTSYEIVLPKADMGGFLVLFFSEDGKLLGHKKLNSLLYAI